MFSKSAEISANLVTLLTATILVAQVRKSPDVAETDGHGYAGEEEVELVAPLTAPGVIFEAGLLLKTFQVYFYSHLSQNKPIQVRLSYGRVGIAPWICLHFPSCSPGFESRCSFY